MQRMNNPTYHFQILPTERTATLATGSADWIPTLRVDQRYLYVDGKRFPLKLLDRLRGAVTQTAQA